MLVIDGRAPRFPALKAPAREIAVAVLFLLLAAAMTWPLAANLSSAVAQPDDPFLSTWTLDWDYHAAVHHLPLFDANIFHPARLSLAFSENLVGIAVLFFPLFAAGVAPLTIHNLAILLGFAACGYAMYALARYATGCTGAAIVAGIAYAFVGFRFHHLPHLHIVWAAWLPLLLLALLALAEKPTVPRAAAFAAVFAMNGLTALHWLAFGSVAVVAAALAVGRTRRFWLLFAASLAAATLILLPFVLPYVRVASLYGMTRTYAETLPNAAIQWRDWFQPSYLSKVYGRFADSEAIGHERTLFAGFLTYILAAIGVWSVAAERRRGRRTPHVAVVWLLLGILGARGLHGAFHTFLFHHLAMFRGIRMPVRWAMIAYVGLALLDALGAAALIRGRTTLARVTIVVVLAAAMLLELRVAPLRWYLVPLQARPMYAWIGVLPLRGAVAELPMTQAMTYDYLWRATVHHKALINGVSGYAPPAYEQLASLAASDPIPDEFLDRLESMRCSLVVVHAGILRERNPATRAWLARATASGRLAFVRRFDAGARGDYVFAVTRVEPNAAAWRAPEVRDPAGRTPGENARLFIERDDWTYSAEPFANLHEGPFHDVHGKIFVAGWALARDGIEAVNLRFANGRYVVRADRLPREDTARTFPWYPKVAEQGFMKTIEPFPGIDGPMDMQLELVDGRGGIVRKEPFWFNWHPKPLPRHAWNDAALDALLRRLNVPPAVKPRIVDGSAGIADYAHVLFRDAETETDAAFAGRILETLLGRTDARLASPYLEMLTEGFSRDRVIESVLKSDEFARTYYR
jgi:hypothetical protein